MATPRFYFAFSDGIHRDIEHTAVGLKAAERAACDFLDGERARHDGDLRPALEVMLAIEGAQDIAAMLAGMGPEDDIDLTLDGGDFYLGRVE